MKFIKRSIFGLLLIAVVGLWWSTQRADIPYDTLEQRYSSPASKYMELKSGDVIHFRDQGLDDKPVLVLVHGYSASLHTWEPWVEILKDDYRIVSLDLPGHGLTRQVSLESVSIPSFVLVIDEVATNLGIDTFTIIGSSMGGATAWAYALDYSERLDGLVLVGASGWPREEEAQEPSFVLRMLSNPVIRPLIKNMDVTSVYRSGLEASFVDKSLVTDEMVDRYFSLARAPGHRDSLLKLRTDSSERLVATPELVSGILVPTLVLHGENDNLVPIEGGRKFFRYIPNAERKFYPNVGHIPQEEIPAKSAQDLRDFVNEIQMSQTVETPIN